MNFRVPAGCDSELREFLGRAFEVDVKRRSSAGDCLQLDFFKGHAIPKGTGISTVFG